MRRLPPALLALPLYAVSRAVPAEGAGLWLRLLGATLVVLLPGLLAARALRVPRAAGGLVWALAAIMLALGVTVLVHASLWVTLGLTLAAGVVALPFALRVATGRPAGPEVAVAVAGVGLGIALWWVAGVLRGDALFHLARVRKLDAFHALSLHAVDEFRDGGLHPGYAFPLWHAFLALVARLAAVDPRAVLLHEASILAPLAFLVAYEAGAAVFRSPWAGGAVATAQVALIALAPGGGGAYSSLALPATVSWQLLAPAVVALVFCSGPRTAVLASVAVGGGALALVHPTYAVFTLVVLSAYVGAQALLVPRELGTPALAVGALAAGSAVVLGLLAPIARSAAAQTPSRAEVCRSLERYRTEIVGSCGDGYHLAADVVSRRGSLAVAALLLVPVAALSRRRWSGLVLGATAVILALELLPFVFPHFAAAVSISQARRAAGFVPLSFALVGGIAVLARPLGPALLPLALGAGVLLQWAYPGDFGAYLSTGSASWPVWVAAVGAAAALVVRLVVPQRLPEVEQFGALAAAAVFLLALPVAIHGFSRWDAKQTRDANALTPGLVRFLRERVPKRAVVFSNLETSYRIAAYAPVYVAAAPPAHVADTPANDPRRRRRAVIDYGKTGDLAIPRRFGAGWLVVDRARPHPGVPLPSAYRDRRYSVYRLTGSAS